MKKNTFNSNDKKNLFKITIGNLTISLILGILLNSPIFSSHQEDITNAYIPNPLTSISHSPISIDGNTALDAFCLGAGTDGQSWATAHVIEGLEIICERQELPAGHSIGIEIKNTDKYLIIKDCYVEDSIGVGSEGGIYLQECQNINITGCVFSEDDVGINAWRSHHINISANNFLTCGMGVKLWGSDNNIVFNNFISYSTINGIHLYRAECNIVSGNKALYNRINGIKLEESKNNIILGNNASYNSNNGINLDSATENNQVYDNFVCNNENGNINDFGSNNDVHDNDDCTSVIPSYSLIWMLGFSSLGFIYLFHKILKNCKRKY